MHVGWNPKVSHALNTSYIHTLKLSQNKIFILYIKKKIYIYMYSWGINTLLHASTTYPSQF